RGCTVLCQTNRLSPVVELAWHTSRFDSNGEGPCRMRLANSGPTQKSGVVFASSRKLSFTKTATPAPKNRVADPAVSSKTTASIQARPSARVIAGPRSAICSPYLRARTGCSATDRTHVRTSSNRIGLKRTLIRIASVLSHSDRRLFEAIIHLTHVASEPVLA